MIKKKILIIILFTFGWNKTPDFIGEVLQFSAGFRIFPAGNATLSIQSDSLENELAYILITTVKTNSFLSAFYEVNDIIYSWLSPKDLSLKKTVQTIREGKYKRDHESIIVGDSIAISINNEIKLSSKVYDPIAFIYYLRMQQLNIGNRYNFLSYGEKSMKKVFVDITKKEKISVPAGTFNCYKIEPVSGDGKPLLKNNGIMRVWLSDDSLHVPIKIEQNTNIGTMVMKLKQLPI